MLAYIPYMDPMGYEIETMAFINKLVWSTDNQYREYLRWKVSGSCCQLYSLTHPKIASVLILQQPFQ